MPQIKGYDAPDLGLQPSERASDAAAGAARTIGHFSSAAAASIREAGSAIGDGIDAAGTAAVRYIEHREISHGAATYAALNDRLTTQWNEMAKRADPNDPTVAAKFREEVLEPALQEYGKGFLTEGGLKFAQGRTESIRNHMFVKTAADMSSLAAAAVSVNVSETANRLSNTAMNDPSAVPHLLKNADELVGGIVESSPNIKGTDSAKARMGLTEKMKEAIVKAGAQGAIAKAANPEAEATRWGQMYPQYISGADLKTLSGNARSEMRARNYDYELNRRRTKEIASEQSVAAANDYLIEVRSNDPQLANDPTAQRILHDDRLLKTDKNNLLNLIDRQLKPETDARLSAQTTVGLLREMREPGADLDAVMEKAWKARLTDPGKTGSLTDTDFNRVRQEIIGRKTPEGHDIGKSSDEFIKAVSPQIDKSNPLMGKVDQDGHANVYRLKWDLARKIEQYRKAGKDWRDLLDPSKPDYMGTPAALTPYQKPLNQSVRDAASRLSSKNLSAPGTTITGIEVRDAPITPRKPNETPADYLKRIGQR